MKAMIFAAGLGKRLGLLTKEIPKALVEINGKSILRITVEKLAKEGFDDIIINVHHFADMVEEEIRILRNEGYSIAVSDERKLLLETAGGLFNAKWFFGNEPFLLYNADIIANIDLRALYRYHCEKGGIATLAVKERKDNRYFLIDKLGLLRGWCNKSTGEQILTANIKEELSEIAFSGIHVVCPAIFGLMNEGVCSMTTLYLNLASTRSIYTWRHDGDYWADIGTAEDLERVRRDLRL
jgi:NDP-sugar pyrophosphorylase family protein